MKKLAICIPNYNKHEHFFRLIKQTVEQLKRCESFDDIEVCISDDVSLPDISEKVAEIIANNPNYCIRFQKNTQNKGRWGNIKESIAMSNAEYIWVIGNDDLYAHIDAVEVLMKKLFGNPKQNRPDILTFPQMIFDGNIYNTVHQLAPQSGDRLLNLTNKNDFDDWYAEPSAWLNFFSDPMIVIIKKSLWEKTVNIVELPDNGFGFWIVASLIALKGVNLLYVDRHFIVRDNTDDAENFKNPTFAYVYIRDCLILYQHLLKVNECAAEAFDVLTFGFYYSHFGILAESIEINEEDMNVLAPVASNRFSMLKRHYFHSSRYDELKNKKVMIFGAGIKGVAALKTLADMGIETAYFVDNDSKKHGCKINDVEVISAEKSLEIQNAIYIIATIYFCYSIFRQLLSMGVADEKIAVVKII